MSHLQSPTFIEAPTLFLRIRVGRRRDCRGVGVLVDVDVVLQPADDRARISLRRDALQDGDVPLGDACVDGHEAEVVAQNWKQFFFNLKYNFKYFAIFYSYHIMPCCTITYISTLLILNIII